MIRAIFITDLNADYAESIIKKQGYKRDEYFIYSYGHSSVRDLQTKIKRRYYDILKGDIKVIYIEEGNKYNEPEKFIEYDEIRRESFLALYYY